MASRSRDNEKKLTKRQTENLRATAAKHSGAIMARLAKHVLGEDEMTSTQVRAAEILLRKTVPDLSAIEHEGGEEHTHYHITDKPLSENEWESRYQVDPGVEPTNGTTESTH